MSEVNLLAKSIEIDTLQKMLTQLSTSLATVTLENRDLNHSFKQSLEDNLKKIEELSSANVSLVVSRNEVHAQLTVQQERIRDMEDDLTGVRHEKERHEIINDFIFTQIKDGSMIIYLPSHTSIKKIKKVDLRITLEGQTLSGMVTYIDDMYQQLDNPELRRLLKE
jgi:hypothetical protein